MLTQPEEQLMKATHNSLAVRFGTSVPYALGTPVLLNKGFGGGVNFVAVPVDVPERETGAIIPIARQRAYSYLGEHGLGPDAVQFQPMVGDRTWYYGGRRVGIFLNENESAHCPVGARKRGARLWVMFEFVRDWQRFYPDAPESPVWRGGSIGQWVAV
jgi:hypothetical protein